jgi:predicted nucleotide-binding protein
MWELPKLFIASSSRAKILAAEIAKLLNERELVQAEAWTAPDAFSNNKQLLKSLLEHSRSKDFAVVILTKDDELKSKPRKGKIKDGEESVEDHDKQAGDNARQNAADEQLFAPRDNCIFELGLFIGAFGTPERCFLLTSLDSKHLNERLSDLGGQIFQGFVPPGDMESKALCRLTAQSCVPAIEHMVEKHGHFLRRPRIEALTTDELLAIEAGQAWASGRDLISPEPHSAILIKESEPPETELKYARVVRDNIVLYEINYHYFFEPRVENCALVARMLRSLIISGLVAPKLFPDCERLDERECKWFLLDRTEDVKRAIEDLKDHLFIRFSEYVQFDEFCIHNANRDNKRCGYVKVGNRYAVMSKAKADARYEFYAPSKSWPPEQIVDPNPPKLFSSMRWGGDNVEAPEKGAGNSPKDKRGKRMKNRKEKTPEEQQKEMQERIVRKLRVYFPERLWGNIGEACFGKERLNSILEEIEKK